MEFFEFHLFRASEVAKFLLLIYLAGYLARFADVVPDKALVDPKYRD